MMQALWDRFTRHLDPFLFGVTLMIVALGLITLYSATNESLPRVSAQAAKVGLAIVLMWLMANTPPQLLARIAIPLYATALLLLLGVMFAGQVVNGARRWINLGFGSFQPSEMMKLALPLILAWYFDKHENALRKRDFLVAATLIAMPFALIAKQPDLGTALLVGAAGGYILFLAGLRWRVILGLIATLAAASPLIWARMHDYQRDRILTLLDPSLDPQGDGYHITQASIALGSGGSTGKGWLSGTQGQLDFLPERHTDFIFAVYGEEFGLIGNLLLLFLYLLLIGRGMHIAANASTLFGRLLAGSITLLLFTYCFVNMGMVSGILPVVGVPLPFMSYGGTAMIILFLGLGILMSIHSHRKLVQN